MKPTEAERLMQAWREEQGYVVHRCVSQPIWRDGRVVGSHSNDILGCVDLLCVHPLAGIRLDQVTTGGSSAVTTRRRKLEAIYWFLTEDIKVAILQVRAERDPRDKRRNIYHIRHHHLSYGASSDEPIWTVEELQVPMSCLLRWKGRRGQKGSKGVQKKID